MTRSGPRAALPGRPDNVLRLADGRLLGYGDFGDPAGTPVMLFHGFPGSRITAAIGHEAAARAGVRLIAPDRPGMGLSTFQPGRRIADWPSDVAELADALALGRFAAGGISGGGPYAAVCALRLADRLTAAAIISGIAPFDSPEAASGMNRLNRALFTLARRAPWLARAPMLLAQLALRAPERAIDRSIAAMPEADRAIMRRPEVRATFVSDFVEAFRAGVRGPAWELVLYARPWGFRLQDIAMQVDLWQGEADKNVPVAMGRYQAAAIANCRARFFPGEGHLLVIDHMDEIFGALVTPPAG